MFFPKAIPIVAAQITTTTVTKEILVKSTVLGQVTVASEYKATFGKIF